MPTLCNVSTRNQVRSFRHPDDDVQSDVVQLIADRASHMKESKGVKRLSPMHVGVQTYDFRAHNKSPKVLLSNLYHISLTATRNT